MTTHLLKCGDMAKCHKCERPAGSLLNRFGEPDAISPNTPLGPVEACPDCGKPVCPECLEHCERTA